MYSTKTALILLPFLIMAAVVIGRLSLGPGVGLLPLLALGPAFAATVGGLRLTVTAGAVALVLAASLIAFQQPDTTTRQEAVAFASVLGVTAASVLATMLRRRRERELADIRAIADVAQRVLLQPVPSQVGSLQLAVRYKSAAAQALIGGDLYEAMATPAGLRVVVGDVQGKGLTAVRTASVVLGAFREAAPQEPDLAAIAARVEASLIRSAPREQFVTAILAEVPEDGSKVELLNCGHPPPLLLPRGGPAQFLGGRGEGNLPLGLAQLADSPRVRLSVPFAAGDQMLFYTDGVSETRDAAGDFFPLACSPSLRAPDAPDEVLTRLEEEIIRHAGHSPRDDVAMLLIRRIPGSSR